MKKTLKGLSCFFTVRDTPEAIRGRLPSVTVL